MSRREPAVAAEAGSRRWTRVTEALTRPYPVTFPMVVLVSMVPLYLFLPDFARGEMQRPELSLDRLIPLRPSWALVYGPVYAFLIMLPIFIVRRREHIDRTVRAYLAVWTTAYVVFLFYPTEAPRPVDVTGAGFGAWGLRALYDSDPPYNCFPSLHVAHSFVSALTSYRVHRGVGAVAIACTLLVGLSTLFTKQHYVADVAGGLVLAFVACAFFLRRQPWSATPASDRQVAPLVAMVPAGIALVGLTGSWIVYRLFAAA